MRIPHDKGGIQVKFKKFGTNGFGCLGKWESPDLNDGMVVFYGPNESGKTTIFKLISTILYGWDPVSSNPLIPYDASSAECDACIEDSAGEKYMVHRRLKSRAQGTMVTGDKKYELANRPVDFVRYIPSAIFNELFALTLDELCFPDEGLWQKIQDRLLGGQYGNMFNPIVDVVSKLDDEAGSLWRPNRMGKPKDRQLAESCKKLRIELEEAEKNERAMEQIEKDIINLKSEIDGAVSKKARCLQYINRYEKLYPVVKKLRAIEEYTRLSGNISDYDSIPDDVQKVLNELDQSRENLNHEYDEAVKLRQNALLKCEVLSQSDKLVLNCKDEIESIISSYGQVDSDLRSMESLDGEIGSLKEKLDSRGREVLEGGWKDEYSKPLIEIDEAGIRSSIQSFKSVNLKHQEQEAVISGLRAKLSSWKMPAFVLYIASLLCAAGAFGMIIMKNTTAGILSGMLSLLGCILLIIYILSKNNKSDAAELKEAQKKLDRIEHLKREALDCVVHELKGLPISKIRAQNPDETLLLDVITLKEVCYNIQNCMKKKNILSQRLKEAYDKVMAQIHNCGLTPYNDILNNVDMLKSRLEEASEHFRSFKAAKLEIEGTDDTISGISDKIKNVDYRYSSLKEKLEPLNGDSLDSKICSLLKMRKYYGRAQNLKEELYHDDPDIGSLVEEIKSYESKGGSWEFDDYSVSKARVELEQVDRSLNELNEKMGSLKKDIEQRNMHKKPGDIKGLISELENERKLVAQKRDRLSLIKNIIIEGDRVYREENQPDVLQKAGKYLDIITGGKYNNIYSEMNGNSLAVKNSMDGRILDVEQNHLSRGTREQIYLTLRIASAEHIEKNGEVLPLIFDEVLVNWDGFRRGNMIKLLKDISSRRQVFLFTCHESLAYNLSDECDAQVVELMCNKC